MKRISTFFIATAVSALMLNSCIYETFPTSGATAAQVAKSDVGLDGLLRSIPSKMSGYQAIFGSGYAYDFCYPGIMVILNAISGDMVVTAGKTSYDKFNYWMSGTYLGKDWGLTNLVWDQYYPWIKNCNDVISACKAVDENELTDTMRYAYGVALTYRAQLYLDLVRMFEPKETTDPRIHDYEIPENIKGLACVLITEEQAEDPNNNPRATVEEIYDLIFSDLESAEQLLEGYSPETKQMPAQAVAYGVLARAYLERGTAGVAGAYEKAASYARKAIDEGGYSPLTQDQWEDPTTGFNSATSNNAWMWCLSISETNVTNLATFMAHMSCEEAWTNYGWNVGRGIVNVMYDQIADDDFRKHSWLDPDKFDYYEYKSCRSDYKTFFTETLNAYANIKFRPGQGNYNEYKTGAVVDIPLMRVEEMYLIEAEAIAAAGNLAEGQNKLESFMRTWRSPSYSCPASDLKSFQEEVAFQARIEFWGEGIPFWYKKRLALGIHLDNTNCSIDDYRLECDGIIPWWNFVISLTEEQTNNAIVGYNNPEPSGTLDPIIK